MKLNETKIRTSNNFNINDINLDLDIKDIKPIYSYDINTPYNITNETLDSKIGLKLNDTIKTDIDIIKDNNIICNIESGNLKEILNLNILNDSKINIIYKSTNDIMHHLKLVLNVNNNINTKINLINIVSNNSDSFIAIENNIKDNSDVTLNFIDIGGKIKISNYYLEMGVSKSTLNNIYLGFNKDIIDTNYYANITCPKSKCYMNTYGILSGNTYKAYKGTIDFKSGSSKSIGNLREDVTLLSNDIISKSLPMLLCGEEDMIGTHSKSTGMLDKNKLYYMESKGISTNEAKKILIKAKFNYILNDLDDDIKNIIDNYLDEMIKEY